MQVWTLGRLEESGNPVLREGLQCPWLGEKFYLCLEFSLYMKSMLAWEEEVGLEIW